MKMSLPGLDIESDDCIKLKIDNVDFSGATKQGKITATMNWWGVNEKLPDEFVDVLTLCISHGRSTEYGLNMYPINEKYMAIDSFIKWSDGTIPSFRTDRYYGKVIAWMPLPKPPPFNIGSPEWLENIAIPPKE